MSRSPPRIDHGLETPKFNQATAKNGQNRLPESPSQDHRLLCKVAKLVPLCNMLIRPRYTQLVAELVSLGDDSAGGLPAVARQSGVAFSSEIKRASLLHSARVGREDQPLGF
jgi:hypothetical protein